MTVKNDRTLLLILVAGYGLMAVFSVVATAGTDGGWYTVEIKRTVHGTVIDDQWHVGTMRTTRQVDGGPSETVEAPASVVAGGKATLAFCILTLVLALVGVCGNLARRMEAAEWAGAKLLLGHGVVALAGGLLGWCVFSGVVDAWWRGLDRDSIDGEIDSVRLRHRWAWGMAFGAWLVSLFLLPIHVYRSFGPSDSDGSSPSPSTSSSSSTYASLTPTREHISTAPQYQSL